MKISRRLLSFFLVLIFLFSLLQRPILAVKKSYIVYLGGHSHGEEVTSADLDRVTESHYQFLGSFLGSNEKAKEAMFYSYTRSINGFAANLDDEEAQAISKDPNVLSVFLNKERKLHTTRSWKFLGLESDKGEVPADSIWNKARFGEDTIIGNLDTGVWPESKSFNDEGMGPIPSRWNGICQHDTNFSIPCNRKLIGARYFGNGYLSVAGSLVNKSDFSARDLDGHGTHTLSTAGGKFVSGANVFGFGSGTAKGGSPKARVAAYKVCWPKVGAEEETSCYDADILAGFDAAVLDGVDVLSVSLGGDPSDYFNDAISIGSFHAVQSGIVVVASAGNSGPSDGTVSNLAPWVFTVAASTVDRDFPIYVALGNKKHLKGQTLSPLILPTEKFYPLISSAKAKASNATATDAEVCIDGSLDPKKVKGKIVACIRGSNGRVEKGKVVRSVGAVGMILVNDMSSGGELLADPHVLPAAHITYTDGLSLFAYLNSTKLPTAYMTRGRTELGTKPAPLMATFSSKGPNIVTPEILKPDITGPGVNIIAAFTQAVGPSGESDKHRVLFNAESGTSMSCPHIAGVAGLLKTLHPDWSPSAIKSAIMTTATAEDNVKQQIRNSSLGKETPFGYGAGHVRPNAAMDPGLVYDLTTNDYLNFLCALEYNDSQIRLFSGTPYRCPTSNSITNLNYPSITVPNLSGSINLTRTVKNVGSPSIYYAKIDSPVGISVSVKPRTLDFRKTGEEKTFQITLRARRARAAIDYVFGKLTWSDGKHFVSSPIVVKAATKSS